MERPAANGDAVVKYFYFLQTLEERPKDTNQWARAERYLEEASAAGVPQAMRDRSFRFLEKEPAKYMELMQKAAQAGLPSAMLHLAWERLEGQRTYVDESEAVELTRKSADAGNHEAEFELAEMYAMGMGEPRNDGDTPVALYRKAADSGNREACRVLSRRYRLGFGTPRDIMEAARYYWHGAQGFPNPYSEFLDEDDNPREGGDPEDHEFRQFLALYVKARERNNPSDLYELGQAFLQGKHGKKNPVTGYLYVLWAAQLGNPAAAVAAAKAKANLPPAEVSRVEEQLSEVARIPLRNLQK